MASDKQTIQDKRAAALRDNLKRRKEKIKAEITAQKDKENNHKTEQE